MRERRFEFVCYTFFIFAFYSVVFTSCSIRAKAFRAVADGIAPSYSQKEKEALRQQKLKEQGVELANPMLAFLGE